MACRTLVRYHLAAGSRHCDADSVNSVYCRMWDSCSRSWISLVTSLLSLAWHQHRKVVTNDKQGLLIVEFISGSSL